VRDDEWSDALDGVEKRFGVRVSVVDGESQSVVREGGAGEPHYVLCKRGAEFKLLTDPDAWRRVATVHRCDNCGYTCDRAADLRAHTEAGRCAECTCCKRKFSSLDALYCHRAEQTIAPCAAPVRDPCAKVRLLPKQVHYEVQWDIETWPDETGNSRTASACG
jgi:hypothetical protein